MPQNVTIENVAATGLTRPSYRARRYAMGAAAISTQTAPDDGRWYRDAILYEIRVRSFYDANGDGIGDFQGLAKKLDYLEELGVTTLWLLPFYPSPLKDDGYDIANYTDVHADVGSLADFKSLLKEAHRRGLRVITELVLNHTSDEHPWFQRARRGKPGSRERDFYVWSDTPERYREARIIFKDFERSNWTWDPVAGAYFWHRFYSHQPDLNFDNPSVRRAMFQVVDFWLALGVDGLRLDAVPYLFEREQTNCENLPETFEFLTDLRRHVDRKFSGRMLLAEANQWPEDALRYLEGGDKCHMAFHFPLMPRLFMAFHMEDRFPIVDILAQTPPLPESCQWALFLRNHDELTLEMVTDEERDYMYEAYAKDPTMRLNLGIRRRLAPLLENNRRKIELMNTLLLSLPGAPVLYYGDEIGMGDNAYLGDRNGVRTPMQWSPDRNGGFSRTNPQRLILPIIVDPEYHYEAINVETQHRNATSLLWWTRRVLSIRKRYRALGCGTFELLHPDNPRILAFIREWQNERILVVANLSRFTQYVELDLSKFKGLRPMEVFSQAPFPQIEDSTYVLTPGPHAFLWFSLEALPEAGDATAGSAHMPELRLSGPWERFVAGRDRQALTDVLSAYLPRCRWFGGKARRLKTIEISDALPIRSGQRAAHALVLRTKYDDGGAESYFLPVGLAETEGADELKGRSQAAIAALRWPNNGGANDAILVDGLSDDDVCRALLDLFQKPRRTANATSLVAHELPWFRRSEMRGQALSPRTLGIDQSNTSVIFGDRLILKVFRRLAQGANPDLEIGRFLTAKGFPNAPKVAGWLEYRHQREEPTTVAILHEYVPDSREAWSYARDEIRRYFERALTEDVPPERPAGRLIDVIDQQPSQTQADLIGPFLTSAELLGRRTAELHLALASDPDDPDFAPEQYGALYQRSVYQSVRNLALGTLRLLRQREGGLAPAERKQALDVLALERDVLRRLEDFRRHNVTAVRIRHHGDYHLGQVLFTGKDFLIIDFEGEPARTLADRRRKRSPLRDVAGMLRSFHYASVSTLLEQIDGGTVQAGEASRLERWSYAWYRWSSAAFLRAYFDTCAGAPFVPFDAEERRLLLDFFLLEKALYEVAYELNHRPTWLRIPLRGIHEVLADGADGAV